MRRLSNADGNTFARFPSLSHFGSTVSSDNDQPPSDEEELEVVLPSLHDVRFSWTQSKKKADAEAMFLWSDGFSSAEIYKSSTSIGGKTAKKRPQSAKSLGSKKSKNNLMKTLSAQLAMFGEQNLLKGKKSGGALSMDRSGIPFSRHTSDNLRKQRSGNSRDRSSNSLPKSLKGGEAFPINDDNSPDTNRYPTDKKTTSGTNQNNMNESMKEGSQIDNLLWLGDPDEVILAKCTMLLNTKTTATEKLPTMQSIQEFRPRRQSTVITVLEAVEAAKQGKKDFPSVPNLSTKVIIMRSLLFCLS